MCLLLEQQGVEVEVHHHEVAAPGQCEIGTKFSTLTKRADWLQILKYTVWNVAASYGKTATFMPKPVVGDNGSGMHVHQSIWKGGTNVPMAFTVVRFNLVDPAATPETLAARYRAALEMAAYADERGISTVQTEEHHGAAEQLAARRPSSSRARCFGATRRIAVTVSAIIGPLYDPLRLAEDIAVLDLVSGGPAGHGRRDRLPARGVRGSRASSGGGAARSRTSCWRRCSRRGPASRSRTAAARSGSLRARTPSRIRCCWSAAARRPRPGARPGWACRSSRALICPSWRRYYHERRVEYGTEGWCMMPAGDHPAAARRRGPGPGLGRVRRALPARGADVRVLAVEGHPLGGPLDGDDGDELRARGRLPDRHARRVRGAHGGGGEPGAASAVRRDAGRGGLAQSAAVLRNDVTAPRSRTREASRGSSRGEERGGGELAHLLQRLALGLRHALEHEGDREHGEDCVDDVGRRTGSSPTGSGSSR